MGVTLALGKGTLGTWRAHRQHGGRTQYRPKAVAKRWIEAVVKPRGDGAYVHQRLNLVFILGRSTEERPMLQTGPDMWSPEICGGQRVTSIGINGAVVLGAT